MFDNITPDSDGARRLTKSNFVSGWQGLGGSGSFGLLVYQSNVQDDYDDYIERSYVWNSTSFKLNDSVTFVVNADGTKSIERYSILPWYQGKGKDEFDFESDEPKAQLINPILKKTIDPSGIGRTVDLVFDNTPVPTRTYTSDSFLADQREVSSWSGADPSLITQGKALVDDLFDKGISRFLDKSGNPRPIFYGTTGNDVLSEKTAESSLTDVLISKIKPYQKNGLVLIGGDGNDEITGGGNSDRLLGGDGDDILFGGRMQDGYSSGSPDGEPQVIDNSDKDDGKKDILEGGKGSDTYYVNSRYSVDNALTVSDGSTAVAGLETSPIDTILDSDGNGKVVLRFDYSEANENGVNTDIARYGESITLSGVWDRKDELDKYYGGQVFTWAASENFDLVGVLAENGSLYIFNQFNDHGNYALAEIKNFGSATGGGSSGAFLGISLSGGNPSGNGSGTGTGTGSGSGGTGTGTGTGSGSGGTGTGTGTGTGSGSGGTGTGTGTGSGSGGTGTGTGTGTGSGSGGTGTGTGSGSGGTGTGTGTGTGSGSGDTGTGTGTGNGSGDTGTGTGTGNGSGDTGTGTGTGNGSGDTGTGTGTGNGSGDTGTGAGTGNGSGGSSGTVTLAGTDGADRLVGTPAADVISGGKGDDYLSGGDGGDTYLYNRGDGADTIDDNNWGGTAGDDRIVFGAGISQSDLSFSSYGTDLIIKIAGSSDQIRVSDGLYGAINNPNDGVDRIEKFVFADGSQLDMNTVQQGLLTGTDGNDNITGYATADAITGGKGDDYLSGRGGGDTYLYNRGDGADVIDDNNWANTGDDDQIVFGAGISQSDLSFSSYGTDLIIKIAGTNDQIRVSDGLWAAVNEPSNNVDRIEKFVFADGSQLDMNTVQLGLLTGTDGNDNITGYATADAITGGKGDDYLSGHGGGDTYLYSRGDGSDTIDDNNWGGTAGDDQIVFGAGISQNDLGFYRDGTNLIIKIAGTSDQIRVSDGLWAAINDPSNNVDRIERFVFAGGSQISMSTIEQNLLSNNGGSNGGYVPGDSSGTGSGGAGTDNPPMGGGSGGGSGTPATGGAGSSGGGGAAGDPPASGSAGGSGGGTPSTGGSNGSGGTGGSSGGGSSPDAVTLAGTDGADRLVGTPAADVISGGKGDDYLSGGDGGDTYLYNRGDGADTIDDNNWGGTAGDDRIVFGAGISQSDLSFSSYGTDLIIKIAGSSDQIRVSDGLYGAINNPNDGVDRIEKFVFADGSQLDMNTVQQGLLTGTDGNDNITGYATADAITGGKGDDYLSGRGGGDTYLYNRGDGADVIDDNNWANTGDDDQIVFGAGISQSDLSFSSYGTDLIIKIAGTNDQIRVSDGLYGAINNPNDGVDRIEKFVFADGSQLDMNAVQLGLLTGTDGNDNITGYTTADAITGGKGDDYLSGRGGGDTYLFNRGDGSDTIDDNNWANTGDDDQIVFGAGISRNDIEFYRDGTNLIIKIAGTNDQIRVSDGLWAAINDPSNNVDRIERFVFAGGSQISMSTIEQNLLGTDGGSNGDDGSGTGSSGGSGNSLPMAGRQSRIRTMSASDGNETASAGEGTAENVTLDSDYDGKSDDSSLTSGTDKQDAASSDTTGVEKSGDSSTSASKSTELRGTDGPDNINGFETDDIIAGGMGDDNLSGRGGADIFVFGPASGNDVINDFHGSGSAHDLIQFDHSIFADASSVLAASTQVGSDIVITISSHDTIVLRDTQLSALSTNDFRIA
ncbi:beta strand repeat-containing protein [Methylobacterium radiotolerans]|uniref:beta strand repeat-containing protein n=3 Tax=Methylobacterium radiotolerans TaxID=31998 RepID=UPI00131A2792|nr:calcium-binding protein [Methylobacterium radiotolerans]